MLEDEYQYEGMDDPRRRGEVGWRNGPGETMACGPLILPKVQDNFAMPLNFNLNVQSQHRQAGDDSARVLEWLTTYVRFGAFYASYDASITRQARFAFFDCCSSGSPLARHEENSFVAVSSILDLEQSSVAGMQPVAVLACELSGKRAVRQLRVPLICGFATLLQHHAPHLHPWQDLCWSS
jgi:hypothetical protein